MLCSIPSVANDEAICTVSWMCLEHPSSLLLDESHELFNIPAKAPFHPHSFYMLAGLRIRMLLWLSLIKGSSRLAKSFIKLRDALSVVSVFLLLVKATYCLTHSRRTGLFTVKHVIGKTQHKCNTTLGRAFSAKNFSSFNFDLCHNNTTG